jgi:hypothetical protein
MCTQKKPLCLCICIQTRIVLKASFKFAQRLLRVESLTHSLHVEYLFPFPAQRSGFHQNDSLIVAKAVHHHRALRPWDPILPLRPEAHLHFP